MKYIQIPTVLLHVLLTGLAFFLLEGHQDGFLAVALPLLLGHIVWSFCSKRFFSPAHVLLSAVQLLILHQVINPQGFGSGLALFFYDIALAVSVLLVLLADGIKLKRKL